MSHWIDVKMIKVLMPYVYFYCQICQALPLILALRLFRSLEYPAKEVFYPATDGADSALFIRRDAGRSHSRNSADQNALT